MNKTLLAVMACAILDLASSGSPAAEPVPGERWWKGNLHTHSLWSDGDDFPEMIADWYKRRGYDFLAISDHNVMAEGQRWIDSAKSRGGHRALEKYRDRFPGGWVEERDVQGTNQVRLKPLGEYRHLLEENQKFLLFASEELSDRHLTAPVHINVTNLRDALGPQGGSNVLDVMQRNVDAVLAQREKTGQPMFPHLNHPNFGWGVTAEELMRVKGERFFEVYNGHPSVRNEGDATHANTERMWDVMLTWRLTVLNLGVIYGLAVDDSHHYHEFASTNSNSGRGWVMVRSRYLTPEHLIRSLEAGDFHASSGVELESIEHSKETLRVRIRPRRGETYRTQFIGTRKGYDSRNEPVRLANGEALRVTHRYSPEVGAVLAEVEGVAPEYTFKGDEIYVRAKVVSSRPQENATRPEDRESAWIQPVVR
jgi:hypothetical protein